MDPDMIKLEMHSTSVSKPWAGSTRRSRLPSNWSTLRDTVISQARGICQATMRDGSRCTDRGTDVDHIERGDNHDLSNLQLLCKWHHGKKTAYEANQARPRLTEKRPPESHPGLL